MTKISSSKLAIIVLTAALVVTSGVGYLFREPLLCQFVSWKLQRDSRAVCGQAFRCDRHQRRGSALVFDGVTFVDTVGYGDTGYRLTAAQMKVDCRWEWSFPPAAIAVTVDRPVMSVTRRLGEELVTPFDLSKVRPSGARVSATVTDAQVEVTEYMDEGIHVQKVAASADYRHVRGVDTLSVDLHFGRRSEDADRLDFVLSVDASGRRMVLSDAKDLAIKDILRFKQFFRGKAREWQVAEGRCTGVVSATLGKDWTPVAVSGELGLYDLLFSNSTMGLKGGVEQVTVSLRDVEAVKAKGSVLDTSGSLELHGETWLTLYREASPYCRLKALTGGVFFDSLRDVNIAFLGKSQCQQQDAPVKVEGRASFRDGGDGLATVDCRIQPVKQDEITAHLITQFVGGLPNQCELKVGNCSATEYRVFQAVAGGKYPKLRDFDVYGGRMSGVVRTTIEGLLPTKLEVVRFDAEDLQCGAEEFGFDLRFGRVSGTLSADLATSDPIDTVDADLTVEEGLVRLDAMDDARWNLSNMETQLRIRGGAVEHSVVSGEIAGFEGTVTCDRSLPHEFLKVSLHGTTNDLLELAPGSLSGAVADRVGSDPIEVTAAVTRHSGGFSLDGVVQVKAGSNGLESVRFGCDIDRISQAVWGERSVGRARARHWRREDSPLSAIAPAIASVGVSAHDSWLDTEAGHDGFVVRNGWLNGERLSLDKFLSPFLFPGAVVTLDGTADVRGNFDQTALSIDYLPSNLVIAAPACEIVVPGAKTSGVDTPAFHHVSLVDGVAFGRVPVRDGRYFHRSNTVAITSVQGDLALTPGLVLMPEFTAECEGLSATGGLVLDYSDADPRAFDVDISLASIDGTVPDVQQLLLHFGDWPICRHPMGGRVGSLLDAGRIHFGVTPGHVDADIAVKGELFRGRIPLRAEGTAIEDLHTRFSYDYRSSRLSLESPTATLRLGEGGEAVRYGVRGDGIGFTSLARGTYSFDLSFDDDAGEAVRLSGNAEPDYQKRSRHRLYFGEATHLAGSHPTDAGAVLNSDLAVAELTWKGTFAGAAPVERLQPLLLWLARDTDIASYGSTARVLADRSVLGDMFVDVSIQPPKGKAAFHLSTNGLQFDGRSYETAVVKGKTDGELWSIEQLQLDEVTAACDVRPAPGGWKIDFLGIDYGDIGLLGSEGRYDRNRGVVDLQINLLEAQIENLPQVAKAGGFWEKLAPEGVVRGVGRAQFGISDDLSLSWNTDLKVATHGVVAGGWRLSDSRDVGVTYGDGVWTVADGTCNLVAVEEMVALPPKISLDQLTYDATSGDLAVTGLSFAVPADRLPPFTDRLAHLFPYAFNDTVAALVKESTHEGTLAGTTSFGVSLAGGASPWWVDVFLEDGSYRYTGQDHTVSDFVLACRPDTLQIGTRYLYNGHSHGLAIDSAFAPDGTGFSSGTIRLLEEEALAGSGHEGAMVLSDWETAKAQNTDALTIDWRYDDKAVVVEGVSGTFCGVTPLLTRGGDVSSTRHEYPLTGTVDVDWSQASQLLSSSLQSGIEDWGLGSGYRLEGDWAIPKADLLKARFQGYLLGSDFTCYGLLLQRLKAEVTLGPEQISIKEAQIADAAGTVEIEEVVCIANAEKRWFVSIPKVAVDNFHPSALHHVGELRGDGSRSLMVKRIEVSDLTGDLSNRRSFHGIGHLDFINPSRRSVQNTIFAIPADIISRIGLDFDVLNPVTGTVAFSIRDGKVFFDKFKDVYSEGRVSKFYLPSGYESYMDFTGGLSVKVRMKQYNLIFKIAELFTVTVQGNLGKPTYTIQKQATSTVDEGGSDELESAG